MWEKRCILERGRTKMEKIRENGRGEKTDTLYPSVDPSIDMEMLTAPDVIKYLASIKAKQKHGRDPSSLSFLLSRPVTQSQCVRLGTILETIINKTIVYYGNKSYELYETPRNEKGKHQKDLLFLNKTTNHVIYAELKSNIRLDTEKRKATVNKIKAVERELVAKGHTVSAYLVSCRYLVTADIPKCDVRKYTDVSLMGISEFLSTVLGLNMLECTNYAAYSAFLERVLSKTE
jgi:hypothetical protein